jgi:protoporphyrinogen oxidase
MALDMVTRMLVGSDPDMVESADEWATAKFGKRANERFFKYYIEKSTGIPSNKVSAHWATERSRFYEEHNLWEGPKKLLSRIFGRSESQPLIIHYPKHGVQTIAEKLGERIERAGGKIFLSTSVNGLATDGKRINRVVVRADGERKREVKADIFVNTLPITDLWKMLVKTDSKEDGKAKLNLNYRSLWLFYFFINRPKLTDNVQIYFPEQHYFFKRIYEPKNLDPDMGDPNSTAVCVEVGYTERDSISRMDEGKLADRLTAELCDFYQLDPSEFTGHFSIKAPHSYPIYELGYVGEVLKAAKLIYSFSNLYSIGRQGLFRNDYMMNSVMESAEHLAKFLQTGKTKEEFLREPIAKALFF